MIDLDDFEADFDGAILALVTEVEREIAAIPEKDRDNYCTAEAAKRLARVIEMKAPDCLVEMIETSLARRLRRRAKARREGQTPVSARVMSK